MEESTLDRGVLTVLKGVDLEKYIPSFEKYKITMDLFVTLTEEDLRTIGVENPEDLNLLHKYINKFQRSDFEELTPLKQEEVAEVLKNTHKHLREMDVATSYISSKIKLKNTIDFMNYNGESYSSAIMMFCDRVEKENENFVSEINKVIQEIEKKHKKKIFSGKLLLIGFSTLSIVVTLILGYKKYR